jgi:hypothetical protein
MDTKSGSLAAPASPDPSASTPTGFHGAVGSLPLVDLLQVWSMNGFSGLVTVTAPDGMGRIYFVDGTIVHADADGVVGEAAVGTIIGWPQGSFELFPNTATLARTIEKSVSHLLLDVHRLLDERRRAAPAPPPAPPPTRAPPPAGAGPAPDPARALSEQLRAIPGVLRIVRFGPDGRPLGDPSPAAEALAAKGLYLALNPGAAIARAFGLRALSLATLRGAKESLVLVQGGGQHLALAVAPDAALDQVAAQVRAHLTRPAPR